eukprot:15391732-Alexandrium_andersonii.AAC.1
MALNTIPQVPVADLFSHWCRLDPNYQDLALEFQGPVRPDGECVVSFAGAIYIPGMLHLVDNCTKGLLSALQAWDEFKDSFVAVLTFFHYPHNRNLYEARLLQENQRFLMSTGPPLWEGGRAWGTVEHALNWLLPREGLIHRTWSLDRIMHNQHLAAAAVPEGDEDIAEDRQGRYQSVGRLARSVD